MLVIPTCLVFGLQGKVCLFSVFRLNIVFRIFTRRVSCDNSQEDKEDDAKKLQVRRKLWRDAKEAAHKRNQIGLLPPSPHVSCLGGHLPAQEAESRPPILEQYQPTPQTPPSVVTYCLIHNHHSNSYILRCSNIGAGNGPTNCEADATRPFRPDFDNVFRNIERWECAVLFP